MNQCFLCLKPIISKTTLCEGCSIYIRRAIYPESSLGDFTTKAKQNIKKKIKEKTNIIDEYVNKPIENKLLAKKNLTECVKIGKEL